MSTVVAQSRKRNGGSWRNQTFNPADVSDRLWSGSRDSGGASYGSYSESPQRELSYSKWPKSRLQLLKIEGQDPTHQLP